jgi:zinc finger protein
LNFGVNVIGQKMTEENQNTNLKENEEEKTIYELPDDEYIGPTQVESYCVNCGDNGITSLLLTRIPFFRDVIVSSFVCQHCGNRNQEIQFGGVFDEKGVQIELSVLNLKVKKQN